jgi:amino acid transporter
VLYVGLCASLALTGTFRQLAVFASAGTLGVYFVSALGVLQLRRRGVTERENPFVVPGGPVIPIVAALMVVGLLSSLTGRELLATAGLAAAGLIVGAVRARASSHPS